MRVQIQVGKWWVSTSRQIAQGQIDLDDVVLDVCELSICRDITEFC